MSISQPEFSWGANASARNLASLTTTTTPAPTTLASAALVGDPSEAVFKQLRQVLGVSDALCCRHSADIHSGEISRTTPVFIVAASFSDQELINQVADLLSDEQCLSVIPVVSYDDQEKAAMMLEMGCVDYLLAPFSDTQLQALFQRQLSSISAEEDFVSGSHLGRRLLAMAQRVAMANAPVLITGETGTGKEMMARYIHRFAQSETAPFIAVNCAAIPEQMLESLLFGHERGAFTGASQSQPGKFELANGGTLLLDEIGELPMALQAKLLRVLQEKKVERLGGAKEIELNVRVIAATNRDLKQQAADGQFRSDLLFRLDVLPLHLSPLRERREDILVLAEHFIRKHAPQDDNYQLLTTTARNALLAHEWPGNVRELENCLQRALVLRKGLYIQAEDLGLIFDEQDIIEAPAVSQSDGKAALKAKGKLAEYQLVLDTIRRCGGHKAKAAEALGMTPRALRYRLTAMRNQGMEINI